MKHLIQPSKRARFAGPLRSQLPKPIEKRSSINERSDRPDDAARTPAGGRAAKSRSASRDSATVLLVEDDLIVAEIYRLSLARAGFSVLVANNGEGGLQQAIQATPDFIFLDIRMPKMDGLEVLRQLAALDATRDIPVVMLSNYDDHALVESSRSLGAKEHLVKVNTDPTELAAIVERWLNDGS